MATVYSRVTLVHGTRQVDLALPGTLPLADVMPQLLRFCAPEERPDRPAAWALGRLGGPNFALAGSLADEEVADGDILELRAPHAAVSPAHVEDVRDAVEEAVDESGRQWDPATTVRFAIGVATAALAAAILLPQARQPRDAGALALAAVVALGCLPVARWCARRGDRLAAQVLVGVAGLWGGLGGWLAGTQLDRPPAIGLAAALCGALIITILAQVTVPATTPVATAQLAAAVVLGAAALPPAVLALTGHDWLAAVRLDGVLAVLVVGMLPRVSLTLGGLAGDDYRVRNFGLVTVERLAARIRQSAALLHGGIVGVSVVGAGCAMLLADSASTWDRLLGPAVGLALVLRSRVFSRVPHIVPLRVAGLAALAAHGLLAAREAVPPGAWLAAVVPATAVGFVAMSAVPLSDVPRAHVKRLLNLAEAATVVALVPLVAGALGCFDLIGRLAN
jgi:type VII secretion integral membrane protein EccD